VSSYTDDIEYDEEKLDNLIFRMDKIKTLENIRFPRVIF